MKQFNHFTISQREKLGSEVLTVDNTVGGVSFASIPARANHAEIQVLDAGISFTLDGTTAPTATLGMKQAADQLFELEGRDELLNFTAIRLSATDARLYIEYSAIIGLTNT